MGLLFFFFLTCPHKRGEKIQTSNFHFIRHSPNQLNYLLGTIDYYCKNIKMSQLNDIRKRKNSRSWEQRDNENKVKNKK
jgi:hypothetical protein